MCRQHTDTSAPASVCHCEQPTAAGHQRDDDQTTIHTPLIPKSTEAPRPLLALAGRSGSEEGELGGFVGEVRAILRIAMPMVLTGLLLYSRSMVSMLFLGRLGDLALAGGALAIGFANITGYSILSGLAMGMEPICGQAFGANRKALLGLALQRTVLLLLCVSFPIALLWLGMRRILVLCGQDPAISTVANDYILASLPDLALQSLLHPLRVYLRTQSITMPLTYCAAASLLLHVPINYLLVSVLGLGVRGVALAGVWTNLNLVLSLVIYVHVSGVYSRTGGWQLLTAGEAFKGWGTLLSLAVPSCVSVCLEWWWYELMILLCGLLPEPRAAVASMGVLIQTTALVYVFPSSLGFGVSTRVGNELGANRPGRARTSAAVAVFLSATMGLAAMGFAAGMRDTWGRMFTDDAEILRLTSAALPIVGLCELGNCPQTVGCGVLRGSARPADAANVNLGAFYLVGMPVAVALGFALGVGFCGLWMGLLAAQVCCAGLMLYAVGSTDWDAQARRAQALTCPAPARADLDGETGPPAEPHCREPFLSITVVSRDQK
uniref:Protein DETOXIFICATION n=1 Tax=Anthurium amnicola TaxID=1678845 RepID=A0A1D1Y8S1_9ARAE